MADLKALTSKKVAGIPVAYLVLGFVIIALYSSIKMKPKATPKDATSPDGDNAPAGNPPDTSQPVFSVTPTITQPSGPASVASTPMADTDTLWERRAIDWLRQNGYTLDVATSAITKYLNGQDLTSTEGQARDAAVRQFGLPPESIPETSTDPAAPLTIPTSPTPPPASTVRKPQTHHKPAAYYRATGATRTAAAIARKNGLAISRLHSLNPHMKFPVRAGTEVRVR